MWSSAPYLHDGSAATLGDAVRAHNNVTVSDSELTSLVAYLGQIDALEPDPSADVTNPVATITGPTSAATLATTTTPLASLSGTASDNVGVTQVTWVNDRGGSGTATGTTSWSVSNIALSSGANVLTVTARDAAGNLGTDVLTVTYTPPDTTLPVATITGPTSAATFATTTTPLATLERDGLGQRGRDAGHLGERPGRLGHGDGHDGLVGDRHCTPEWRERADGDGARCGGQRRYRCADGDLYATRHDTAGGDDHCSDECGDLCDDDDSAGEP